MKLKQRAVLMVVVMVGAVSAVWTTGLIAAANEDSFFEFGTVGIVRGQIARLSVVNAFRNLPVQVELMIIDSQGETLAKSVQTLELGEATYLDLDADTILSQPKERTEIRAAVRGSKMQDKLLEDDFIPTFEVFVRATGKTIALYALPIGQIRGPVPADLASGMIGIARGQTARLSVIYSRRANHFAPPVKIQMFLLDGESRPLAKTRQLLEPGKAASLDLRVFKIPAEAGMRTQIRAVVRVVQPTGTRVPVFIPTLEVFNTSNNLTTLLYPSELREHIPNPPF
jgi:hypothetical protein